MFVLLIESGPAKGSKFEVNKRIVIGRGKADIRLTDSKVSSRHALIEQNRLGQWWLKDNNSRNGTKVNGVKIQGVELKANLTFSIGESLFKVQEIQDYKAAHKWSAKLSSRPKIQGWREDLTKEINKILKNLPEGQELPLPFTKPVRLQFLQGQQMDQEWFLGYGPRYAGRDSLDLEILDASAPRNCFSITPFDKGALFKTDHPDQVLLNSKSISAERLKEGDIISVGETKLQVTFIK